MLAEKIVKEIERLPEPLAREVLDFIGYLEARHSLESREAESLKQAQQPVMEKLWKNQDDEVWNDL